MSNENDFIKIIGLVETKGLEGIWEYTAIELKFLTDKIPKIWGVVVDIEKEIGLITITIKNTYSDEPLKVAPLLELNQVLEYKKIGRVLPPILSHSMKKVLITVDGFWTSLIPNLVQTLKKSGSETIVAGPFSLKELNYLKLTPADVILPIDTFTSLSQEILNSDSDTLISLNTPLLQRKITNLMWTNQVNKYMITVNNQWI